MGCSNSSEKKPKGDKKGAPPPPKTPKAKTPKSKTSPRDDQVAPHPATVVSDRSANNKNTAPPPPPPPARPASNEELNHHRREVQQLNDRIREMQFLLDDSRLQTERAKSVITDRERSLSYVSDDDPSDTDSPVLNDLMRPNDDPMYNDYNDEDADNYYMPYPEQEQRQLKSPRLHSQHSRHSHAARLRNHQMTATELLEEAPPPPPSSNTVIRSNSMGSPTQVGTWAWWSKSSDGRFVRDGAAMTTDDGGGIAKLRNLRNAIESQMSGDQGATVVWDVSTCSIGSVGCHSLSVLLSSPRIAHTAVITTLDLSSNPIGDDGLGVLLQSLTHHAQEYQRLPLPMVNRFALSKCELKHGCGLLVALHLFFGEICLFPDLEELDLSFNEITPDAFRTILEAICSQCGASATLRSVNFAGCNLPPLALVYLQDALELMQDTPTELRRMELYGHRFGVEADRLHTLCHPGLELITEVPSN